MDLMQRGGHQRPATQPAPQGVGATTGATNGGHNKKSRMSTLNIASIVLLFSITVLIAAVALFIGLGGKSDSQAKYVDTSKYQAVFLNGGQVYFGKITSVNSKTMRVGDIYYLRVNQQVQPDGKANANSDVSLVKLGCELHGPQDAMVVNNDQVSFWENLKDDGQVVTAIKKYKEQNPKEDCNAQASQSTSNSSTSNTTTNTPATSTTTKKP